jgi:hypothetical protein
MSKEFIDIKPIIVSGDSSFFIFVVTLITAIYFGYILFKKFYAIGKKSCKHNCEEYYFEMFSSIDWSKPKEAAYLATKYGEVLATDRRKRELFYQLKRHLERYKYKKDVAKVDSQTLNYYNLYKQVCDESL